MPDAIPVQPAARVNPRRKPLHPAITEDLIRFLVETFYARVRTDRRLGPIFEAVLPDDWSGHLNVMCAFWSSVTRMSGRYKGKPVAAHVNLADRVTPEDFDIWLALFREAAREVCPTEVAEIFVARAENIAESLKLAMFARRPAVVLAGGHPAHDRQPTEPPSIPVINGDPR